MRTRSTAALAAMAALTTIWMAAPTTTAGGAATSESPAARDDGSPLTGCGAVDTSGRFVRGGCSAAAYTYRSNVTVRTAFGSIPFGACTIAFDVSIDGQGRMWLDNLRIGGLSPCNDMRPCAPPEVLAKMDDPYDAIPLDKAPPWTGKLRAAGDGNFTSAIEVCVDTCIGRYEGKVNVSLVDIAGPSWRMVMKNAGIGETGFAIDGKWEVEPRGRRFDLSPPEQG